MRMLGAVTLVLSALLLARGYKSFVKEGIKQAEAFLELFVGLKRHISVSGAPIDRYISGGECPMLSELGFYREYEARGSLFDAFSAVGHRLFLPKGIKKAVQGLFLGLGKNGLSGEVRLIESGVCELKEMIAEYKGESERSVRVVSVVLVAAALGLLIILV